VPEMTRLGLCLTAWKKGQSFYPLHFLKLQFIVMLFYDLSKFAGGCYLQVLEISQACVVSHRQSLASAHAMTFRTFLFFYMYSFF
jgi:hypothetical protein